MSTQLIIGKGVNHLVLRLDLVNYRLDGAHIFLRLVAEKFRNNLNKIHMSFQYLHKMWVQKYKKILIYANLYVKIFHSSFQFVKNNYHATLFILPFWQYS